MLQYIEVIAFAVSVEAFCTIVKSFARKQLRQGSNK